MPAALGLRLYGVSPREATGVVSPLALKRDGAALEPRELYETHFDFVWNALRRLGARPGELEDLSQEVFLRVLRNYGAYDASRPLRPWIFAIAARTLVDFQRLPRHDREVFEAADRADESATPDAAAAAAQERRVLRELLDALEPDRRAVFLLHEYYDQTAPQIAEALEIPLNTAYSRLRLARVQFAELVRKRFGEERP